MGTKILMSLAVLLLAISQVVHIAVPSRELLNQTTASSSLLVTSVSGDSPSSGFEVSHGRGATEEKALLDAPNIFCAPSTHPQAGSTEEKALLDAPKNWCLPPPPLQGMKKTSMLVSRGV